MAEQLICNEKSVVVREGTFLPTLQSPYNFTFATVAQLVEQLIRNEKVVSWLQISKALYHKDFKKSRNFKITEMVFIWCLFWENPEKVRTR